MSTLLKAFSPDPKEVYERVKKAIETNEPLAQILYEFLQKQGLLPNILNTTIKTYKKTIQLLASDKGKQYMKATLDETLDYLKILAEAGGSS